MRIHCYPRIGITLIEVLIVLSIVSILSAITFQGIVAARERSRALQCSSNLRQIGIGLLAYQSNFDAIPLGIQTVPNLRSTSHLGTLFHLLPFLEQNVVYDSAEPYAIAMGDMGSINQPIAIYHCPSDPISKSASTNYLMSMGKFAWVGEEVDGPFGVNVITQVPDGTSTTVGISERLRGTGFKSNDSTGKLPRDLMSSDTYLPLHVPNLWMKHCSEMRTPSYWSTDCGALYWDRKTTLYNHILPPNSSIPDCLTFGFIPDFGIKSSRSLHVVGVHSLFLDGHVQSISNVVDIQIWRDIATVNGGEIIASDMFQ